MAPSLLQWLLLACLTPPTLGYADLGSMTLPEIFQPTLTVPRPDHLPDDIWMRYAPYQSHITAIAPSVKVLTGGSLSTSWSLHRHVEPTRTLDHPGLRRRGVLAKRGVLPPIPTCRPCDSSGNPLPNSNSTDSGSPICSVVDYDGVFRSGSFAPTQAPDYCFNAGYTGPLIPGSDGTQPSYTELPCCPVCYPPVTGANSTSIITSGVLSDTVPFTPGVIVTPPPTPAPGAGGGTGTDTDVTVTITSTATEPGTSTRVTLSIETITPTGNLGAPVLATRPNTIVGCGTASGCGTVDGDGTVFLAPFGFPAVTSVGTVIGCAPKVIGCGTMIATTGIFTGEATITACGEGTGSATMVGSGTVWPAGFMDLISFVSSGTVTGAGRVRGCGTLIGTGTFTVSEPFTATESTPTPTVNVYVSYCPGDSLAPFLRLAGNVSDDGISPALLDANGNEVHNGNAGYVGLEHKYTVSNLLAGGGNYTSGNMTGNNTLSNGICHVCPEDSGICCPPYSDCGSDGHCPWAALVGCGYARFGVNLVDKRNSSTSMGMGALPQGNSILLSRMRAPGLPGSKKGDPAEVDSSPKGVNDGEEAGLTPAQRLRKRIAGASKEKDAHLREHKHGSEHGHTHRVGLAHRHGH